MYHVSCEPLRIFWNDDTTCSTRVPRVLSITGWIARNPARSRQHAWHSCRAGCIVISENPQGLATRMVLYLECVIDYFFYARVQERSQFFPRFCVGRSIASDSGHECFACWRYKTKINIFPLFRKMNLPKSLNCICSRVLGCLFVKKLLTFRLVKSVNPVTVTYRD